MSTHSRVLEENYHVLSYWLIVFSLSIMLFPIVILAAINAWKNDDLLGSDLDTVAPVLHVIDD